MRRTRKRKVRRKKTRGGHPVAILKPHVGHTVCGNNGCVSQTMFALGYLDAETASHLQTRSEERGVKYDIVADILNFKYGPDHRFSNYGITDAQIKEHVPNRHSTFGAYFPNLDRLDMGHAIMIVHAQGNIYYIDPQQGTTARLLSGLPEENRRTLRIVYMLGTSEEDKPVNNENIDQIIATSASLNGEA